MTKQGDKKFTWVIKDFSSLQSDTCHSDIFVIGGCKWFLSSATKVFHPNYLFLYLVLAYGPSLPSGWRRYVKYRLTVVNQLSEDLSVLEEGLHWFDSRFCNEDFASMLHLSKLHDRDGGFLVNGELKPVVEVEVVEVIGELDASEKSGKVEKDGAESSNLLKEASLLEESLDVNGFQVSPSQVESVRRIFERHPDIAVEFRAKNQHLRKACMNFLLSLIETMCQSLEELSTEDLVEADIALTYLKDAGFKVDWLEMNLDQVIERKEKEKSDLAMLQEKEENLLKLKQKCAELDSLAEEQKAELSATRASLSFNDLV